MKPRHTIFVTAQMTYLNRDYVTAIAYLEVQICLSFHCLATMLRLKKYITGTQFANFFLVKCFLYPINCIFFATKNVFEAMQVAISEDLPEIFKIVKLKAYLCFNILALFNHFCLSKKKDSL